jgi:hypothetical protein
MMPRRLDFWSYPATKDLAESAKIFILMPKGFIKNKEDFTCENCGVFIIGNGYTNHCHECFYSKHVDINPGDRLDACNGLMKPISVQGSTNNITITHKCLSCGFTRNNKLQEQDNVQKLAELVQKINSQK